MSAELVNQDPTGDHEEQELENGNESRGVKRQRTSNAADDDDDDDDKPGRERRKIEIKFIQDKSRRHITFSKRKAGIMKKVRLTRPARARDISMLTCVSRRMNCQSSLAPRCCCS